MNRKPLSTPTLIPPAASAVLEARIKGEQDRLTYYRTMPEWAGKEVARLEAERAERAERVDRILMHCNHREQIIGEIEQTLSRLQTELDEAEARERADRKPTLLVAPVGNAEWTRPAWMTPEIENALRASGQDPQKLAAMAKGGRK